MESECSVCGGEKQVLGKLGKVVHLRCRNCGMQFSYEGEQIDCSYCGKKFIPTEIGIYQCSDSCYRQEHCLDD
jgi:ribosomal protein L37E